MVAPGHRRRSPGADSLKQLDGARGDLGPGDDLDVVAELAALSGGRHDPAPAQAEILHAVRVLGAPFAALWRERARAPWSRFHLILARIQRTNPRFWCG
jgi:hypothetical protein